METEDKTLIEQARETVRELKEQNEVMKALLERGEKMRAEEILGGNAEAGQIAKEETAEEKWAREAKIRYAGSGMCPV